MIAIVDYDAGNLKSVEKAFAFLGQKAIRTRERTDILSADKVVLPGVGSFGDAMDKLKKYDLVDTLKRVTGSGTPFLGICMGLQLLFESSEESPGVEGLSILKGHIIKIPPNEAVKIPHIGWNSLKIREGARLFEGINENPYVYFVHSYYLKADCEEEVSSVTWYGTSIHASVEVGNLFACQFHPEKSSQTGLQILKNFINL